MFALLGYNVSVVCYSQYLSKRDEDDFKELFCELKVEKKIFYGTIISLSEIYINNEGDLSENV